MGTQIIRRVLVMEALELQTLLLVHQSLTQVAAVVALTAAAQEQAALVAVGMVLTMVLAQLELQTQAVVVVEARQVVQERQAAQASSSSKYLQR
jgi:hypothetical protein